MALPQETIQSIIFQALENLNLERDPSNQIPVNMDTALFGEAALLDSLALVSVIVDVETAVSDAENKAISLTDDMALSQEQSPFSDVRALSTYILHLTSGKV